MKTFIFLIALFSFLACKEKPSSHKQNTDELRDVQSEAKALSDKLNDAVIYEVNIRQYTPEGDFKAFIKHLPRLKEMGIDILWIMPIHPIGLKKRKGKLGSYYAAKDYKAVNPEFGSKEDFRALVNAVHDQGMMIILDWVANHSAWDNVWMADHPDWYTHDSLGNMIPPVADWSDVADLNYESTGMQNEMINSLKYWVEEFDIDGYRCDVAGMVPLDFWNDARRSLDSIKPVFMLAEAEDNKLLDHAFDMDYAWELHHIMNEICKGNKKASALKEYYERTNKKYSKEMMRMAFTSNHDENSWNGNAIDRMGDAYEAMIALSFLTPSMPLVYSGQEAGLHKNLSFFGKDSIDWKDHEIGDLFAKFISIKTEHQALWNGRAGGDMTILSASDEDVFCFKRSAKSGKDIYAIFNFSNSSKTFSINDEEANLTELKDIIDGANSSGSFKMDAWDYRVLIK